ncbi:hypothetical protein OG21DRAFT_1490191 [Imleria badia]|nr:hypothetical protein OG21DRAFT_1490191 [Imleria badia]
MRDGFATPSEPLSGIIIMRIPASLVYTAFYLSFAAAVALPQGMADGATTGGAAAAGGVNAAAGVLGAAAQGIAAGAAGVVGAGAAAAQAGSGGG